MKKSGILSSELARLVARMGHGDMLAITDRGFPFPVHNQTECIDLSICRDVPKVAEVIRATLEELEVEEIIVSNETAKYSPVTNKEFLEIVAGITHKGKPVKVTRIAHNELKKMVLCGALLGKQMKGFVKCGEFTAYAYMVLVSGVDFS